MISIKNKVSINKMLHAGYLLASMFDKVLANSIHQGMSTLAIDSLIEDYLNKNGLISKTKGYKGYQHVCCVSINDEVVHGVPSADKIIKNGDLVKIDVCASWKGYCADMARSFLIGDKISPKKTKLIKAAQKALDKGIAQAQVGNRLSDISAAIQHEVESHGFGVIRDFAGHGIGKQMHEEPEILNYGNPGQGMVLQAGMTFAIEPMITMGDYKIYITDDGWTVKTVDKSLAAHVEDTIVITENGPKILTRNELENRIS
ncbi:MAG: type I methionyl aminopeptidase [Candidatus Babeliales bacterium]